MKSEDKQKARRPLRKREREAERVFEGLGVALHGHRLFGRVESTLIGVVAVVAPPQCQQERLAPPEALARQLREYRRYLRLRDQSGR